MGRSACIVCDQCGHHHVDAGSDRTFRPARWPEGWIVIVNEDERLDPPVLCSEECLLKFNEKTGFAAVNSRNQKESK